MTDRSPSPRRFLLLRHGETDWNRERRLQGGQEVPLNALGREQAAAAGRLVARLVPDAGARPWVASPMGRARETAAIARGALGLDPEGCALDERLREISFGRWEGMTWREVRRAEPDLARAREAGKWGFRPPGGESYADLAERVRPALAALPEGAVVVAHGGVARALLVLAAGRAPREAAGLPIWQGDALVFEDGRARWGGGTDRAPGAPPAAAPEA